MADLSTFLRNALYDHALRNTAYTPPATVYLALYSDATTELTAGGYAPQAVAMGAPTDGVGPNSAAPEFGPATGSDWPAATHVALHDAATAGNRLTQIKALAAPKTAAVGDSIRFPIGNVDFSFQ